MRVQHPAASGPGSVPTCRRDPPPSPAHPAHALWQPVHKVGRPRAANVHRRSVYRARPRSAADERCIDGPDPLRRVRQVYRGLFPRVRLMRQLLHGVGRAAAALHAPSDRVSVASAPCILDGRGGAAVQTRLTGQPGSGSLCAPTAAVPTAPRVVARAAALVPPGAYRDRTAASRLRASDGRPGRPVCTHVRPRNLADVSMPQTTAAYPRQPRHNRHATHVHP
jgi:hypothetical protein